MLLDSQAECPIVFGITTMSPGINIGPRKYIYLWLTLSLNLSVTALTGEFLLWLRSLEIQTFKRCSTASHPAGRIWWMARKAKKILGPGLARKYYSALAIVYGFSKQYSHVLVTIIYHVRQSRIWCYLLVVCFNRPNSHHSKSFPIFPKRLQGS